MIQGCAEALPFRDRSFDAVLGVLTVHHWRDQAKGFAECSRVAKFKVGPAYDTENIGLAIEQTKFNYELATTDCSDRNSGNSRCGHEFGTSLPPDEKKALQHRMWPDGGHIPTPDVIAKSATHIANISGNAVAGESTD